MGSVFSLKKNLITKKIAKLNKNNCYAFWVDKSANKIQIKKDIEESFSVKVKTIKTIRVLSKMKKKYTNDGVVYQKPSDKKKVYVFLQEGQTLNFENFAK